MFDFYRFHRRLLRDSALPSLARGLLAAASAFLLRGFVIVTIALVGRDLDSFRLRAEELSFQSLYFGVQLLSASGVRGVLLSDRALELCDERLLLRDHGLLPRDQRAEVRVLSPERCDRRVRHVLCLITSAASVSTRFAYDHV